MLLMIGVTVLVAVGISRTASLLGIREWKSRTGKRGESWVEKIVVKLGGLPTKAGLVLVFLSLFLFVGGILVEGRTKIESDPLRWIDQDSQVVEDVDHLTEQTGFAADDGHPRPGQQRVRPGRRRHVVEFTLDAEQRPEVVTTSSLVNTMGKILMVDGATAIPPTAQEIEAAAEVAPDDIRRALVNADATAAQVNLRLAAPSPRNAVLVEDLQEDLDARIAALTCRSTRSSSSTCPTTRSRPSHTVRPAVVGVGLLENLSSNRAVLLTSRCASPGCSSSLRFRSLSRALLALVPVFLAVGAPSLIVGLLGIQLSPLTTVSGPLITASRTEFSVLIPRLLFGRTAIRARVATASDTAASRTGRAFFTSACTTIGGFAVLIVSPLPLPLRDFGIIVTLNVDRPARRPDRDAADDGVGRRQGLARHRCPGRPDPRRGPAPGRAAASGAGAAWRSPALRPACRAGRHVGGRLATDRVRGHAADHDDDHHHDHDDHHHDVARRRRAAAHDRAVRPRGRPGRLPRRRLEGTVVGPVLWQLLVDQGVPGNQANCAVQTAYSIVDEQTSCSPWASPTATPESRSGRCVRAPPCAASPKNRSKPPSPPTSVDPRLSNA
ncbi:MAG: hypothetical protein R2697_16685 [Ilumatobacteraceae bacterium]